MLAKKTGKGEEKKIGSLLHRLPSDPSKKANLPRRRLAEEKSGEHRPRIIPHQKDEKNRLVKNRFHLALNPENLYRERKKRGTFHY